jgi:hypothetical protein
MRKRPSKRAWVIRCGEALDRSAQLGTRIHPHDFAMSRQRFDEQRPRPFCDRPRRSGRVGSIMYLGGCEPKGAKQIRDRAPLQVTAFAREEPESSRRGEAFRFACSCPALR